MEVPRPIPGWIPSTPALCGGTVEDLAQRTTAIAIHFWAPWNAADPSMDRSVQAVAERFVGRVSFFSCNIDLEDNLELCKRCGIGNVPTLAICVSGKLRRLIVGSREPEKLAAEIESWLREPDHKPWWKFLR